MANRRALENDDSESAVLTSRERLSLWLLGALVVAFCVTWYSTRTPRAFVVGRIALCSPPLREAHAAGCRELQLHPRLLFVRADSSGTPDGQFVVRGDRRREFVAKLPRGRYFVSVLVAGLLRTPQRPLGPVQIRGGFMNVGVVAPANTWDFAGTLAPE